MTMLASQITSLTVVYSIVDSGVNQRKHQSSASLAFVREIHRGPVNFPHKWPVTRKMFPFDDVIMVFCGIHITKISQEIDGLVQDCSNSIANVMELLQSCTKPSNAHYLIRNKGLEYTLLKSPPNLTGCQWVKHCVGCVSHFMMTSSNGSSFSALLALVRGFHR